MSQIATHITHTHHVSRQPTHNILTAEPHQAYDGIITPESANSTTPLASCDCLSDEFGQINKQL